MLHAGKSSQQLLFFWDAVAKNCVQHQAQNLPKTQNLLKTFYWQIERPFDTTSPPTVTTRQRALCKNRYERFQVVQIWLSRETHASCVQESIAKP
jgi:hypothetical protein